MPMTTPEQESEVQRVAYHLWVLAHRPEGGPERFLKEAERLVAQRLASERLHADPHVDKDASDSDNAA